MRPERFQTVSVLDDAIETERMPFGLMMEYSQKRDYTVLTPYFKAGMQPTIYHVKAVPHALWETYVMAGGNNESVRFRRAFQVGVERVDNWRGDDGVGVTWQTDHKVAGFSAITDDECNSRFSPAEVLEIGSVVFQHSFLRRRISQPLELPSLCVEQLVRRTFHRVEPSQSTASTATSSEPSAGTDHQQTVTATT